MVESADGVGPRTVLVVDDEPDLREVMCRILRRHGYQALVAENPSQAGTVLTHHDGPIDLLLTDLGMPGASGTELADLATQLRPELRVVYVSGLTQQMATARGLLAEQAVLVEKPFTADRLIRTVEAALRVTGGPPVAAD